MSESSLMFSFRIKPRPVTKEVWSDVSQLIDIIRDESGNIANPIFADLMDYKYRAFTGKVKLVLRRAFWVALPNAQAGFPNCDLITFSASRRADYKALLRSFAGKLPNIEIEHFVGTIFTPCLSLFAIPTLLLYRKKLRPLLDYARFDEKVLIYASLLHAVRVQQNISRRTQKEFGTSNRTFVFLNTANAIESAWSRSFSIEGNKTISLQHGVFVDFSTDKVPFDLINYCNVTADLFVGWSQSAVGVVKSYMPKMRCQIGGRLGGYDLSQLKDSLEWTSYGRRICVLGRDFHFEHNIRLMTLVSAGENEIYVCFHPTSNIEKYRRVLRRPLRIVKKSDFVLGVDLFLVGNSSIYFDLVLSGYAAVLFSSGNNDFQGLHSFGSAEELESFTRPSGERSLALTADKAEALSLVVGLGVDNYEQILGK